MQKKLHLSQGAKLVATLACVVAVSPARGNLVVSPQSWDANTIQAATVGATDAAGVEFGNSFNVGPFTGDFFRPIIPFSLADFASVAGQPLASATLSYEIAFENLEADDGSHVSEIRLFTTTVTNIPDGADPPAGDIVAALTGDGGAFTAVGGVTFADGVSGVSSINFSPASLAVLEAAINGTDPTIGIAFREFESLNIEGSQGNDLVGIDISSVNLTVTAIPEPSQLLCIGLVVVASGLVRRTAWWPKLP
ncbi:MAG: hypothetical protein AAF497_17095 [Planctomycetota bacterium]